MCKVTLNRGTICACGVVHALDPSEDAIRFGLLLRRRPRDLLSVVAGLDFQRLNSPLECVGMRLVGFSELLEFCVSFFTFARSRLFLVVEPVHFLVQVRNIRVHILSSSLSSAMVFLAAITSIPP